MESKRQEISYEVETFVNSISFLEKRIDAYMVLDTMQQVTGDSPTLWESGIIGFGDVHYKYSIGREGNWFRVGFAVRNSFLIFYLGGAIQKAEKKLKKLGKYKIQRECLCIHKLKDINIEVLKELIKEGYDEGFIGIEKYSYG